jgi:demethylmenaquinone methyltransferase/2-methoxy-6-polyprenyl-1,4-benzoquinol methylase
MKTAALPVGDDKAPVVEAMFDRISGRYDRMNRIISLGQDRRWRRRTIDAVRLTAGARVLDLACGTGDLCNDSLARGYTPIGVDFSAGMLAHSRTRAPLVRADATELPVPDGSVDGVVCGFALRNFVDLEAFFSECARVLRRGGRVVALDAAVPEHALTRAGHHVWFRWAVPLLGRAIARDSDAYAYLPASTAYLPPPTELVELVQRAGFGAVVRATFTGGAVQLLSGTRQ